MNHFCRGCFSCFEGHHEKCGGYEQIKPIVDAIDKSELIIFTTPVYAYHVPGQMKAFLDHFAYRWLVHQPNGEMTKKQALIISTAAGAGMKTTVKDIKNSLDFIPNKYIPLIMLILGVTINIVINWKTGINANTILAGMLSGLASTGLHQAFKNLINDTKK